MSLEKTIEVNKLIDIYGGFLTDKQLAIMNEYFKMDYSLSEIAENYSITKQAVKYSINLSLNRLKECDSILHLIDIKDSLVELNDEISSPQLTKIINKLGE